MCVCVCVLCVGVVPGRSVRVPGVHDLLQVVRLRLQQLWSGAPVAHHIHQHVHAGKAGQLSVQWTVHSAGHTAAGGAALCALDALLQTHHALHTAQEPSRSQSLPISHFLYE